MPKMSWFQKGVQPTLAWGMWTWIKKTYMCVFVSAKLPSCACFRLALKNLLKHESQNRNMNGDAIYQPLYFKHVSVLILIPSDSSHRCVLSLEHSFANVAFFLRGYWCLCTWDLSTEVCVLSLERDQITPTTITLTLITHNGNTPAPARQSMWRSQFPRVNKKVGYDKLARCRGNV